MKHSVIAPGFIHTPFNWIFANTAARAAARFIGGDVNKLALDLDTADAWILTAVDGMGVGTWQQIGGHIPTLDAIPAPVADVSIAGHKLINVGDATATTDALNRRTGDGRYDAAGAAAAAQAAAIAAAEAASLPAGTTLDTVPGAAADVNIHAHRLISVADAGADTDALNRRTGDGRYVQPSSTSARQGFGTLEFYGHSLTYGGSSDAALRGSDGRVAAIFGSEDYNRTKGGAVLVNHEVSPWSTVGNGGWAHIYRFTENELSVDNAQAVYEQAGGYESKRDYAQLWFGANDLAKQGPANLQPFKNALEAVISRLRASIIFEDSDASVTYPTGAWTSYNAIGGGGKIASGASYHGSDAGGGSVSIAVPASFPGGTVVLGLLSGADGSGANFNVTVDGVAAGAIDSRDVNAKDSGTGANGFVTPVVKRLTGLAAGAHVIVLTTTAVKNAALFDGWWPEGRTSPLIGVPLDFRKVNYGLWGSWPYHPVDADIATLNAAIAAVVATFDADVFTIDTDTAIAKNANYFSQDGVHLNDWGQAVITAVEAAAIAAKVRSLDKHAAGSVEPPFVSRNPWNTLRNVIQAVQPDQIPVSIWGRNAGDQSAVLLDLLSQGSGAKPTLALGRTADEMHASVTAVAGQTFDVAGSGVQTAPGDVTIRSLGSGSSVWVGSETKAALRANTGGIQSLLTILATPTTAAGTPLFLRGLAAQTGDLLKVQDSASNPLLNVTAAGIITQYEYAFSGWKALPATFGAANIAGSVAAETLLLYGGGGVLLAATASALTAFYLDPADHAAGASRTVKIRVRALCVTNTVAPGVNFIVGLYPVSAFGGGSGVNPTVASLGAAVASVTFTAPGASNGGAVLTSAAVTFPSAGLYCLAVVSSGTTAANSATLLSARVQYQQV